MKKRAGAANRTWLIILGLILLLAGVLVLLLATGTLDTMTAGASPDAADRSVPGARDALTQGRYTAGAVLLAGLLLAVLGLWWILAQVPRTRAAGTFRLQEDPARGVTSCDPSVLASAVEYETDQLPGVAGTSAVLRGTAENPDLTLKVTVNADADVRDVISQIQHQVVPNLVTALEAPLRSLGLQIEASSKSSGGAAASSTGTMVY